MDCFICCTTNGKFFNEEFFDLYFNISQYGYPIIPLSYAYYCNCKNMYAHNRCLLNIKKCPQCRKEVIKPNLLIKTNRDYYFYYLFEYLKKNPKTIKKIESIIISIIIYLIVIMFIIKEKNILFICLISIVFLNTLIIEFMRYLKYYWLWNGSKILSISN